MNTRTDQQSKATLSISGYRIDSHGIHDRFLPWRHFGFWKYANRAKLETSEKTITLTLRFEGRKKPLKVQFGNTLSNALQAASVLEQGILHSPTLAIERGAEGFLEDANRYLTLKDKDGSESQAELKLAKAKLYIRLGNSKAARKEMKALIANGNESELAARNIRLHSYLLEADGTLARVEFDEISKRFPANQEARTLWAIWLLAREKDNAEEFAKAAISSANSLENRLEIESQLVNLLTRKRRYDEALEIVDAHLASSEELDSEQLRYVSEAKAEIERLKTDKAYNRRMTVWRPLKAKIIGFGLLALVALIFLWPAILETPKLVSDWRSLRELEGSGVIASSGEFSPNLRDLDFGFVQLSFVFSLHGEGTPPSGRRRIPDHYGSTVLRRAAANEILANTRNHSVIYLPDSPFTCTVYPITKENYFGAIAKHAAAFVGAAILLLVFLYYALKELYKRIRYGGK